MIGNAIVTSAGPTQQVRIDRDHLTLLGLLTGGQLLLLRRNLLLTLQTLNRGALLATQTRGGNALLRGTLLRETLLRQALRRQLLLRSTLLGETLRRQLLLGDALLGDALLRNLLLRGPEADDPFRSDHFRQQRGLHNRRAVLATVNRTQDAHLQAATILEHGHGQAAEVVVGTTDLNAVDRENHVARGQAQGTSVRTRLNLQQLQTLVANLAG